MITASVDRPAIAADQEWIGGNLDPLIRLMVMLDDECRVFSSPAHRLPCRASGLGRLAAAIE